MLQLRVHPEYFTLDAEQKDFLQRLLFYDYIEELEVSYIKGGRKRSLAFVLKEDLKWHIKHENYETCGLYIDMIKRFKKEIINFDS